jgi:hypothetical protein
MIKEKFLEAAVEKFGDGGILNRKQIKDVASSIGLNDARWFRIPPSPNFSTAASKNFSFIISTSLFNY